MPTDPMEWLLAADEPWTRYRALVDLGGCPEDGPEVQAARAATVSHPLIRSLLASAARWPYPALRRHNDAAHPLHAMPVLAEMGLRADDPEVRPIVDAILGQQDVEGPLRSLVNIPHAFGGTDTDMWAWLPCDAPTLLYALLAFGLRDDARVLRAVDHLEALVHDNGWRCQASANLGRFRGPGRKADACPIANVLALKALAFCPDHREGPAARAGVETLLAHWDHRREFKLYMFGIGTDFGRLKYPFVWYDILHVAEVLSRYEWARRDPRLQEMAAAIAAQADDQGCYTASSMYRAWQGWSFADKKRPSPWLTFLAARILRRMA